jgi:hypothetical protein
MQGPAETTSTSPKRSGAGVQDIETVLQGQATDVPRDGQILLNGKARHLASYSRSGPNGAPTSLMHQGLGDRLWRRTQVPALLRMLRQREIPGAVFPDRFT